jgi:membrane protein YqaA with SNARE-associated domain
MFAWINELSSWLQTWLNADTGLWGLFISAFASATVLPGSSELVMSAVVTAFPALAWKAFFVALAGNTLGCVLTYGMGRGAHLGWDRLRHVNVDIEHPRVQQLRRVGAPALFLSFLPLVGDALVLAAGWMKMPFWPSLAWIVAGKAARYALLLAGLLGVQALA